VLDLVGLAAKAGSRISKLSGGQVRRLDVALGIVGQPELLFLDERERVAQVGGVLEVRTKPGAGTEVCAEVPG
jgi:ABC-type taurine transport system ATPase subunit